MRAVLNLSKGLSVAGCLRRPGARPSARSRRAQGGTPPACETDGDDVGIGRRKFDAAAHRRMRRGADLAASMPEGGAVKPRMGDGALRRCKGCARSGRHAECPVEVDAAPATEYGSPARPETVDMMNRHDV